MCCTLGFNDACLFQDIGDCFFVFVTAIKRPVYVMENSNNQVELFSTNIFHPSDCNPILIQ